MPALAFTLLWNIGLATALAVVVAALCRLRALERRPAIVHTLWLLVLVKLVTPPLIPLPVLEPAIPHERATGAGEPATAVAQIAVSALEATGVATRGAPAESVADQLPTAEPAEPTASNGPDREIPWLLLFGGTSILGTLILGSVSFSRLVRAARILRFSAARDDRLARLARIATDRIGLSASPIVCAVNAPIVPFLWVRFGGPVIVLPTQLIQPMSDEQVVCILCHELAHYARKDHWTNLFAFFIAVLFWWYPVAWWARRQMRAAQEVCCDGLVLETKPADRRCYAEALFQALEFVQHCSPLPNAASSLGDHSSLTRRFQMIATLNVQPRVSWSVAILAIAGVVGMFCVPVRGQPRADANQNTDAAPPNNNGVNKEPQQAETKREPQAEPAQWLFSRWQASARTDGKIPGALVGQLQRDIDTFIKQYPDHENSAPLAALRPRLDASHDWAPAEAVSLLDDITAISTAPVSWRQLAMTFAEMRNFKRGQPLPAALEDAAWGEPAPNGLRVAWLLEPVAKEYALGTLLKTRVLFHNTGKEPISFGTDAWHQFDEHKARDANGAEIKISAVRYSGLTPMVTFRLAPGEYCEVTGHGIAVGAGTYTEQVRAGLLGATIEAKPGDEVTLTHVVDVINGNWDKITADQWNASIAARVEREGPMPEKAADREQLIRRVTLDIFGVPASSDEIATFTNDKSPDALAKLTQRLQSKPRSKAWAGLVPTGETKFRVTTPKSNQTAAAQPNGEEEARDAEALEPNQLQLASEPPANQPVPTNTGDQALNGLWEDVENDGGWLRFDGSMITYHPAGDADKTVKWMCRYNVTATPMTIDIFQKDGTSHGIFVFERDTLFIALSKKLGAERPTQFKRDEETTLFVLKRAVPARPKRSESKESSAKPVEPQETAETTGPIVVHGILESVDAETRTVTIKDVRGNDASSVLMLTASASPESGRDSVAKALLSGMSPDRYSKLVSVPVKSDATRVRTSGVEVVREKLAMSDLQAGQVVQLRLARDARAGFAIASIHILTGPKRKSQ